MTSPPKSSISADDLMADLKDLKIGGIYPANSNREVHYQYLVSTNPCGFSFKGQFWAEPGIANRMAGKKATGAPTQTSIDAAKITDSHVIEIDKSQEQVAYQKAVQERREKYLPSYAHFLPIKRVSHTGEISPKEAREHIRKPLGVFSDGVDGAKSEKETVADCQLMSAN